ncbi:MAG: DUF3168 domain-containing protein [Pseudomonadota bacterium]
MLTNDLHQALIARLEGDATLSAALSGGSGILSAMPRRRDFPFVLLASVETTDRATETHRGEAHTLLFEVWSRSTSRSELVNIAQRIETLLIDEPWSSAQTHVAVTSRLGCVTGHDRQSRAFVGRLRLRLITEPKS